MADNELNVAPRNQLGVEQEVDLLEYLRAVLNAKYRILLVAVLGAGIVFGLSKLVNDIYSSSALLAINLNEKPGGYKPGDFRANDMIGLIEHDFLISPVADNQTERLLARLRSSRFAEIFIEENELFPYIFSDHWDNASGEWLEDFQPNMREAVQYFIGNMLWVNQDVETGLLNIGFQARSAELAADLANAYWRRFNQYINTIEKQELGDRRSYLEERIATIQNIELQRSMNRLMESQIAAESLLNSRRQYPLEEIQPAISPKYKSYPNRKVWSVGALVGLVIAGIVLTLALVVLRKVLGALKEYDNQNQSDNRPKRGMRLDQKAGIHSEGGNKTEKTSLTKKKSDTTENLKSEYDDWID